MSESVEEERRGSMWPLGTTDDDDDDDDVYTPSLSARLGDSASILIQNIVGRHGRCNGSNYTACMAHLRKISVLWLRQDHWAKSSKVVGSSHC